MTNVSDAITDYRYAILHLSERSQQEYRSKLLVFCAWCEGQGVELEDIRQATIRKFVEALRQRTHPRIKNRSISLQTIHNYLTILKCFFNWLAREDGYEGVLNPRLVKRIEMPRLEEKVMEVFDDNQIRRLLAACDQEYSPKLRVRDRAIISVLLDTGIRAGELCGLTLDNTFLDPLDGHLKVAGKGNKWREVPLGKKSLVALRRYITRYRVGEHREVFLSRNNEPMTVYGLERVAERLGKWAGIPRSLNHPHSYRHTFAVRFLEETGDVYRLSRVLGHSSVKVTEIYVRATSNKSARTGVSVLDTIK